jgi:hypothetical protein
LTHPDRRPRYPWPQLQAPLIWAASLVVIAVAFFAQQLAQDPAASPLHAHGKLAAQTVAGLSAAPLMTQDRIELGLISRRAAALPAIAHVRIAGVDGQILADTGALSATQGAGDEFSAPIRIEGAAVGTVTVTTNPAARPRAPVWPWLLALGVAALLPWLLFEAQRLLASMTAIAAQRGQPPAVADAPGAAAQPPDRGQVLVVANLLNQFSMAPDTRIRLLADMQDTIDPHAARYGAGAEPLETSGLLLRFAVDETGAPARVFEAICAALVLARFLARQDDEGIFRLGLHFLPPGTEAEPGIADTAMLAATASEGQIMASAEALAQLAGSEQLVTEPMNHPLGDDLATTGATSYRLGGLAASHEAALAQELASLRASLETATTTSQDSARGEGPAV